MKKILFITVLALIGLSSCDFGEPGLDGDAFLKINWANEEPYRVETTVLPANFSWDTYYKVRPGDYTVYTEYIHRRSGRDVIDPYEFDIEIWIVEGECGHSHHRDGRDADEDVFFDLDIYPDGIPEFTHERVRRTSYESKSYDLNSEVSGKTLISEKTDIKDGFGIKCSVYKLPEK